MVSFFSIFETFIWSTVLIILMYVLRKKKGPAFSSITGMAVIYVFCFVRLIAPMEMPWTHVVHSDVLYNFMYDIAKTDTHLIHGLKLYHLIGLIWAVPACVTAFGYLCGYLRGAYTYLRLPCGTNAGVDDMMKTIAQGRRYVPKVYMYDEKIAPCSIGIIRKRIYLPSNVLYSDEELYYVLLHEYCHIRNHDMTVKFAFGILQSVYWWNPLVYWLKKDMEQVLELRCDSKAVRISTEKAGYDTGKEYLSALLAQIQRDSDSDIGFDREYLEERFRYVAEKKDKSLPKITALYVAVSIIVMGLSYSFIVQPLYTAPIQDIEEDGAYEVDNDNAYILKKADGTYWLYEEETDKIGEIKEELAIIMIEQSGFTLIEE